MDGEPEARPPPVLPEHAADTAQAATAAWTTDWIDYQLFDGRRIWLLTMMDAHSRVCPALRVCRVASAAEVVSALDEAVQRHGTPTLIRVDQGDQFTSRELDLWARLA